MSATPEIPERFKGVKFTKAGKPDTRSKLGREYQAWMDEQAAVEGVEIRDDPDITEKMNERQRQIALAQAIMTSDAPLGTPAEDIIGKENVEYLQSVVAREEEVAANPQNFASEGQDAPDPHPTTTTTESAPVSEKTALADIVPVENPEDHDARMNRALGIGPMPKLGTHDAAKVLIEHIVQAYPDAKRGDWVKVQYTLRAALNHVAVWQKAHPPGS